MKLSYILFMIFATLIGILFIPVLILKDILDKITEFVEENMLKLECWICLDEPTYNIVKKDCGFKKGYITYSFSDVEKERERLKNVTKSS